jgi:hypothetical protein
MSMLFVLASILPPCCPPILNSVTDYSATQVSVAWTLGTGSCPTSNAVAVETSTDGVNFGNANISSPVSPRLKTKPTVDTWYRVRAYCTDGISIYSNIIKYTVSAPPLPCCPPTINTIGASGTDVQIQYLIPAGGSCEAILGIYWYSRPVGSSTWSVGTFSVYDGNLFVPAPSISTQYMLRTSCDGGGLSVDSNVAQFSGPFSQSRVIYDITPNEAPYWTNPSDLIGESDDTYAAMVLVAFNHSYGTSLNLTSFTIPTGATLVGLVMEAKLYVSAIGIVEEAQYVLDSNNNILSQTGFFGIGEEATTTPTVYSIGSPTFIDTNYFTIPILNAGLHIEPDFQSTSALSARVLYVDYYKITVYYT